MVLIGVSIRSLATYCNNNTYPPIKAAIPKLTESVIVQFPINQIHPVIYASGILPDCASSGCIHCQPQVAASFSIGYIR